MKAGILYPRSNAHPHMMADFVDGIKCAIGSHESTGEIQLVSDSIGFGGIEKEVYEKAEKLLVIENVDILIAYVDLRVLVLLQPLMLSTGKLLIVVNPGANYPQNWVPQPNIVYLTLQHSFLCWLTGSMAGEKARNAVISSTFYDCGYLHIAAMSNGFAKEGGNICLNYINKTKYDDTFEINSLSDYLQKEETIVDLLCVLDSKPASLFYDHINKLPNSSQFHLYVSPMMLELVSIETEKMKNFSIEGYRFYDEAHKSDVNKEYKRLFKEKAKREPSIFSLQGWEAGLLLKEIKKEFTSNYVNGADIKDHFAKIVIESPRGGLRLDGETNYFRAPVYKTRLAGNSTKLEITKEENPDNGWVTFVSYQMAGPNSGWTNTYLCY